MAIVITYKLTGIETLTRMQVIDAVKAALRRMGEHWHAAFAWKRFDPIAYTEYRFARRSQKYNKYKLRHLGHTNPLEASGDAKAEALSPSTVARIRVTRDSVTIPMPTKLNRYNPSGPNLADEVRRVSRAELDELQDVLAPAINEELDNQVPPQLRNRGEIGGRVRSLRLKTYRTNRTIEPAAARRAA